MTDEIVVGDPRFAALLVRAREILDAAVPSEAVAPIDLLAVLDSFGLGAPLVEIGPGRHGGLRKVGSRWHPVVYRPAPAPPRLSPRERFTVAHELAHAILDDHLQLRPVRNSEYWALEAVCHEFANRLLIPECVASETRAGVSGASSALSRIERLAAVTETSLAASARRLLANVSYASAWGMREVTGRLPATTVYRVDWVAGTKRYGLTERSHVKAANPLFSALQEIGDYVGIRGEKVVENGIVAFTRRSPGYLVVTWWEQKGHLEEDAVVFQPTLAL